MQLRDRVRAIERSSTQGTSVPRPELRGSHARVGPSLGVPRSDCLVSHGADSRRSFRHALLQLRHQRLFRRSRLLAEPRIVRARISAHEQPSRLPADCHAASKLGSMVRPHESRAVVPRKCFAAGMRASHPVQSNSSAVLHLWNHRISHQSLARVPVDSPFPQGWRGEHAPSPEWHCSRDCARR